MNTHRLLFTSVVLALVLVALPAGALAAPAVTVSPASGPRGTAIGVSATGLTPDTAHLIQLVRGVGNANTVRLFEDTATSTARGELHYRLAVEGEPGRYTVRIVALGGTVLATAPFTLTPGAGVPTITLAPDQGPCSTEPTIGGSGFAPGAAVAFYQQRLGDGGEPVGAARLVTTVQAGPTGGIPPFTVSTLAQDCRDDAPATPEGTRFRFTAVPDGSSLDAATEPERAAIFTIARDGPATPSLTLDPDRGPCETRPVVGGTGFPPGARITIFSRRTAPSSAVGMQLTKTRANGNGNFAEGVPTIANDCDDRDGRTPEGAQYTFTAVVAGIDGGPSASATFTIDRGAAGPRRCFQETDRCARGRFLASWRAHGLDLGDQGVSERESLALFGYPLSDEFDQRLEDGKTYRVQYFERARFEWHPENAAPHDVLLGQFGRRVVAGVPGAPTQPVPALGGGMYFLETGHNVAPPFSTFWIRNGELAVFGYPISEPFTQRLENGREYTVQYFERARLEHHPENPAPYDVLLGQFGRPILAEMGGGR